MPMFSHTQVEEYLNDVILKMRSELRNILKDSVNAYPTKPRHEWLFDWPSQIILVVNQIFWCQEVEQATKEVVLMVYQIFWCQKEEQGDAETILVFNIQGIILQKGGWGGESNQEREQ
eukprot:scaffold68519_cov16-Tisochrysis_lutea.AAC.1